MSDTPPSPVPSPTPSSDRRVLVGGERLRIEVENAPSGGGENYLAPATSPRRSSARSTPSLSARALETLEEPPHRWWMLSEPDQKIPDTNASLS